MRGRLGAGAALAALLCASCVAPQGAPSAPPDPAAVARGAVIASAGDCQGCHTDLKGKGPALAGGRPLDTQFGTFYAPNITFDKTAGIGTWSEADFHRAMREGRGGHGEFLYPVFPYPSFTGMTDQDVSDLYAYLRTVPASAQPSKANKINFPFNLRPLLGFWRVLYFRGGPLQPDAKQSAEWNRGRYLAESVAHCQECHTPRNALGGVDKNKAYGGNLDGPDGQKAPNITPGNKKVAAWSADDIAALLDTGMTPDGDYMGGEMATVVDGTSKLPEADKKAIAVYIKSQAPVQSKPAKPAAAKPAG